MNEYRIIDERTNEILIVKAENLMDALTEATRIFAEKEKELDKKSSSWYNNIIKRKEVNKNVTLL